MSTPETSAEIKDLEAKLKAAKAAMSPVIVTKISEDKDQVVYQNETSGTKRVDRKGGEAVQYHERPPAPAPEVHLWSKPFDGGKVIKQTDSERTIELSSGTVRKDIK